MGDAETKTKGTVWADDRHWAYRCSKRVADVVVSSLALAVMAVPMAVCCGAIFVTSPGSPIFRQLRVGRGGRDLRIFKLRTMYADAESHVERYLSPEQLVEWNTEHKVENDPRVTKVGSFLRATSLDEVPQLLNVLVGGMSLVGPRPVTREELVWFGDTVDEVLSVRPGLTGYWQAYARNDATWESGRRQEMELYYVRNCGVLLDIRIFFKTFGAVLHRTGV